MTCHGWANVFQYLVIIMEKIYCRWCTKYWYFQYVNARVDACFFFSFLIDFNWLFLVILFTLSVGGFWWFELFSRFFDDTVSLIQNNCTFLMEKHDSQNFCYIFVEKNVPPWTEGAAWVYNKGWQWCWWLISDFGGRIIMFTTFSLCWWFGTNTFGLQHPSPTSM